MLPREQRRAEQNESCGCLVPASVPGPSFLAPRSAPDAWEHREVRARRDAASPSGCSKETQVSPQSWREEAVSTPALHPSAKGTGLSRGAAARLARPCR